ncbi:EthD domain-containing protein [Penicillium angulare]|uniref:EthD domain-containing protein n=1 Tax=Penicillium angulare TaxID=116970 RepID=A0A9W9FHV8_9EURO|nr:EthD domain-containing protein [Penicillium angulare]
MPIRAFGFASRKAGISPSEFKKCYEAHVDLLKRLAGPVFPLSHKRHYLTRDSVEAPPDGASALNPTTPATVLLGKQSDFDMDAYVELVFADQAALEAFVAVVFEPGNAALIEKDEEGFLDRKRFGVAMVGETCETTV